MDSKLKEILNFVGKAEYGEYDQRTIWGIDENDGLQNQYVLYRSKNEDGTGAEVFIDPNNFSEDGTVSMAGESFTKDGSLFAHLISEGGSDWRKIIVFWVLKF